MKKKRSLIIFSLLLLMIGLFPSSALAKSNKKSTDNKVTPSADILIQPEVRNDNIGGKRLGYFNLKSSSKNRELTIKVFNTTNYPLKIKSTIKNATTLDNGLIGYTGQKAINKKLLKDPGTNYLSTAKSIIIPAQQESLVKVKVKPTDFKGTKATAINLSGIPENQKGTITNEYVYVVGIILNGESIKKKQLNKLDLPSAKFNSKKNSIQVKLINSDASYLLNGDMDISFHNAKWLFFQYHKHRQKMKIAPKSDFYFDIPFNGQRLVPGAYKLVFKNKNNQYKQEINKYVEITNDDIRFINKREYDLVRMKSWIVIILFLLIVIAVVSYFIFKRKKRNEELS